MLNLFQHDEMGGFLLLFKAGALVILRRRLEPTTSGELASNLPLKDEISLFTISVNAHYFISNIFAQQKKVMQIWS